MLSVIDLFYYTKVCTVYVNTKQLSSNFASFQQAPAIGKLNI